MTQPDDPDTPAEFPDVDGGPGTRPTSLEELDVDSLSTMRPMATQAVYRPVFDE